MREIARFISGVEVPNAADARMQASTAVITSGVGATGPSRTMNATPANPHRQPSTLRKVSVSSLSQAAANVPNMTAVEFSSALYPAGKCKAAQLKRKNGAATDNAPSTASSRQWLHGQR